MASLICRLLAKVSTRNTNVLISSIFFIADSVVKGHLIMEYLSILFLLATDLTGHFGFRRIFRVFGRRKCTLVRTFFTLRETEDFTALATLPAFLAADFSALGAIVLNQQR